MSEPPPLAGTHTLDPNDGSTLQALGIAAGDQWLDGDVPYWNRYEGVGMPLAGEMQSMAFNPIVLLYQVPHGFLLAQILLESIAGVATLLLISRLGIGLLISLGAGIAFAFNGTFAWLTNAAMNPVAFLPLLLLGIEVAHSSTNSRRIGGWALIAVAVSGSLYAGFPETAFINGLFALGWCIVRAKGMGRSELVAFARKLAAGAVAGVVLAAPILVAFIDFLRTADVGGHAGGFATSTLPSTSISPLFMPYIYGPISAFSGATTSPNLGGFWSSIGGYLSAIQLFLAIATLGIRRLRPMHIAFGVWFVIYLSKTYGFIPSVITLVNLVPGIDQLAYFRYSQPSVSMGLLILAAFGAHGLVTGEVTRRMMVRSGIVCSVALIGMAIYAREETQFFVAASRYRWYFVGSVAFALIGIGVAAVLALPSLKTWRRMGFAVLLAAEAGVMYVVPQLSTTRVSHVDMGPVDFLRANLGLQRFYTLGPIAPNYGSAFGIASINLNDVPISKLWGAYILDHLDANTSPFTFIGSFRANPSGPSSLDELVRNLDSFGEVAARYVVAPSDPGTTQRLSDAGLTVAYDDGDIAIHEVPGAAPYFGIVDGGCTLTPLSWQGVDVTCEQPATLIRRELADDGWSASIDGKAAAVTTTHEIFQSVDVPAGTSRVTFEFAPRHIGLAWLVAAFAALWLLGVVGLGSRERRRALIPRTTIAESDAA
ncbi:MAG: hypothetical protein ABIR32_00010 [Ilumatobacteraceae bacterium]